MAETYYSLTDIVKLCDNLVAAMPTSFYSGIMTIRTGLANIPAADVVPARHGRWIEEDDSCCGFYATDIVCSECNKISEFGKFSYCPNCGALMDKDGDGE